MDRCIREVNGQKSDLVKLSVGVFGVLFVITFIAMLILGSTINVSADKSVNASVNVSSACTLSGTGQNSHTATVTPGTPFTGDIGNTNVIAICNDSAGYAIYAVGYSGDPSTLGNTDLINTNATIATRAYDANYTANSYWSMKLAAGQGADAATIVNDTTNNINYANYVAVPSDYAKVAYKGSATASLAGASFTTTYGVYTTAIQAAGEYVGKVKYVLVHPNNAPAPTETLIMQNVSEWGNTVAAGQEVIATDARDDKTYTVARLADGNLWMTQNLDHDIKTDGSVTYDNTTTDLGYNATTGQYETASWMPDKATYTTGDSTWISGTGDNYIQQSYDPGDLYNDKSFLDSWADSMTYALSCKTSVCDAAAYDQLTNIWKAYYDSCDVGTVDNCDKSLLPDFESAPISNGDRHHHFGNYYNWSAAVAKNDTSSYTTQDEDLNQSICPSGWTLPKGGSNVDRDIFDYYGYDFNLQLLNGCVAYEEPLYLNFPGVWEGGSSIESPGYMGAFWSSTVYSYSNAYVYTVNVVGPTVGPGSMYMTGRDYGASVRCVSR